MTDRITPAMRETVDHCINILTDLAAHYPEDVFPADGKSPDCYAAKGCRLMAKLAIEEIRLAFGPTGEEVCNATANQQGGQQP